MNKVKFCQYKESSKNWCGGVGLFFFTLLIFLSPLVNLVDYVGKSIAIFFYLLLVISGIIATFPIKKDYLPAVLAAGIIFVFSIFGSPVKGIAAVLVFYVAYRGVRQSEKIILNAFFILLIINYLIMLIQLSGIYEIVYSFADYANEAIPISFLDVDSISANFLPQMRPSGIFPAPSYISFFSIILYSIAAFFCKKIDKWNMAMIGSFFVLTGSTLGLVLILLLAVNVFRNKVIVCALLGYTFTLLIYFALVPEIAAYNYSVADFVGSVLDRSMDESILTLNPKLLAAMVLSFLVIIWYIFVRFAIGLLSTVPVVVIIFFPMLLHDASSSLLSFFIVGMGVGMVGSLIKRPT
jgi:hypothetical protein